MHSKSEVDVANAEREQIITSTMNRARAARRVRVITAILFVFFIAYYTCYQWLALPVLSFESGASPASEFVDSAEYVEAAWPLTETTKGGLVPLEAHIISKCPDTRDALRQLILPVMQRVSDKVDFKLTYIGKTTPDDGVECKHGPSECMGNIIELCARELYPDPKTSLGFVMCLTRDYQHIPDRTLIEDCALEHAIDFEALNECATRDDGAHAIGLLRSSVERSAKLGISTSCTLRLNDEVYCVRDNGKWKDCPHGAGVNDLVIAIEKLHRELS